MAAPERPVDPRPPGDVTSSFYTLFHVELRGVMKHLPAPTSPASYTHPAEPRVDKHARKESETDGH